MTYKASLTWSRVVLTAVLTALLAWPAGPGAAWAQSGDVAFSGQATVLNATVTVPLLGSSTTTISDTGPLPSSGGALQASLLSVSVPGLLTADVAHATTIGQADRARSEASVADLSLTVGGNTISASLLRSSAMAVCASGGPSVSGDSEIADLTINGQTIAVSGQPNQTIPLPVGEVIINEQTSSVSGNTGSITVNALHVLIPGVADVVISSAHADVTCQPAPPSACVGKDFVTGGGWILGPSGAKANFGVGGGFKQDGTLFGHLEFIDHGGNGPKVHGTAVTNYAILDARTREIDGAAEVNGQDGSSPIVSSWPTTANQAPTTSSRSSSSTRPTLSSTPPAGTWAAATSNFTSLVSRAAIYGGDFRLPTILREDSSHSRGLYEQRPREFFILHASRILPETGHRLRPPSFRDAMTPTIPARGCRRPYA